MNQQIKKGNVKARETWIEERCQEIDDSLGKNNNKKAYQLVKDLTSSKQGRTSTIQDKNGKRLTGDRDILNRWTEYCSELTAVQGLRFSCYSWSPEPRHPVHVTNVYATESRTPLVRELSADRFSVGLLLHCSPPSRVRAGEWTKVCGGQAPLWSAASAEKQRIFFLFRLQPTRHRYSLTHSTAHMNSCQSTK